MQLDASSNKGSNLRYLTSKSCNMEENFNYNFHHHSKAKTPVQSFETQILNTSFDLYPKEPKRNMIKH